MDSRYIYLIDVGHGGLVDDKYVTAPDKMHEFSNGEIAYEGVINRIFKRKLIHKIKELELAYISLCSNLDVPLYSRVRQINELHNIYDNIVLISLHSNAGKGTGFEIFTSKGYTRSDRLAQMLGEEFIRLMPDVKFRPDKVTDNDLDKEENFYILLKTTCPALLVELMFFDYWNDYKKLVNPEFQDRIIDVFGEWIRKIELTAM